MKTLRFFFVLFYTIFLNSNYFFFCDAAELFNNETDRMALVAFKRAIILDPNEVFNSWNNSLHYCLWQGVSCGNKHSERVTGLRLISQGLQGRLSSHIGNLSFLRIIHLENNRFHGEIPPEIGNLFRLRSLYLNNNSFHGEIPKNLSSCVKLKQINFIHNHLEGIITVELSYLKDLTFLGLSKNSFRGSIPLSLGNLSSLVQLRLEGMMLFGSIPNELGRLVNLQYLHISENNFTGKIPSSMYNLSSLQSISVAVNSLEGNLPSDIGFTLPKLEKLQLGANLFTGLIPPSLSNASQLQVISLSDNRFKGPIPVELGRLMNLTFLGLDTNKLGSSDGYDVRVISYLTNCTKLNILALSNNFLKGPLPVSVSNLSTKITRLYLGVNEIYGTIPSGIGNLVNLNVLNIWNLMLHGNIPSEIGKLYNLNHLFIHENELTGKIPSTLGNLTGLNLLYLQNNNLSGQIPSTLGNCQRLLYLCLDHNNLQGFVPSSIFELTQAIGIYLSHNSLSGSLPLNIGNLKQLKNFYISENKLTGTIPSTLSSCLRLEYLTLSSNSFTGTIPHILHGLRGLLHVDLSSNNFSGIIPEILVELPLQLLNLSFNNLEGRVPTAGIFKNGSVVSLVGNDKLCGGIPELKFPACFIQHSKGGRISLIRKVIAPIVAAVVCLALIAAGFFQLRYKIKKSKKTVPLPILNEQFIKISYQELLQATDGFSDANLIGFGSYGKVYRGVLHQHQSLIAVKVFNLQHKGASKSFISECKALKNVRHRNLLKIVSVCSSEDYQRNDFRAVIYELMPRGSLENWIHPLEIPDNEDEIRRLNLEQRQSIIIDIATAIEYLHCHCQPPIVHGDLKPSNILLDEAMVAHIGDFGLAKFLSNVSDCARDDQSSSAIIKGSMGYVPPEYGTGGVASVQGDVYSFGILVLEIITARRPTDDIFQGDLNLHTLCRMAIPDHIMTIVDPKLLQEESASAGLHECLSSMLKIGVSCSSEMPRDRLEMKIVVRELHLVKSGH